MSLWVVVGGQYGSEGKGKTAAYITQQEDIDICVRCGGPNSGHSFVASDGTTHVVRQLPTGYLRPETRLLIPAGALVDLYVLKRELNYLAIDASRVGVDENAMIVEGYDRKRELQLGLRQQLSSTLCGVGSAVARRALRGSDVRLARDAATRCTWLRRMITSVSEETNEAIDQGKKVLVEGTQGFGLSLYHTQEYPKATSRDTTAAAFLSEVGLSPRLVTEIVLVLRTFPIRVAGSQAGRLFQEITWEDVRRESEYAWEIEERTSVTNLPRRIARFDWQLATRAVQANRPTRIALTGLDYVDFRCYGATHASKLSQRAYDFANELQMRLATAVVYCSASPRLDHVFRFDSPAGSLTKHQDSCDVGSCESAVLVPCH